MENQHNVDPDFDPNNPYGLTQSERFSEFAAIFLVALVLLGSFLKVMFF